MCDELSTVQNAKVELRLTQRLARAARVIAPKISFHSHIAHEVKLNCVACESRLQKVGHSSTVDFDRVLCNSTLGLISFDRCQNTVAINNHIIAACTRIKMATSDRITGLREQIMANAANAFPHKISKNAGQYQICSNSRYESVDVVVAVYEGSQGCRSTKRACLVYGSVNPTYAAWGEISGSVESALESLLEELGKILVKTCGDLPDRGQSAGWSILAL
ncbi:hypothetical protein HII31_07756 [Pseudocercospora fuligena]|uniref:Uncharacterized protein n=1 Tax=Pseudocercospora fuligena TaxID=685502 RepID=A0A8H6RHE8_9PEZI|nr:hypothetical protein HII31_07756 [Pseudocercospora fuligena]